jgi:hypothetical protein
VLATWYDGDAALPLRLHRRGKRGLAPSSSPQALLQLDAKGPDLTKQLIGDAALAVDDLGQAGQRQLPAEDQAKEMGEAKDGAGDEHGPEYTRQMSHMYRRTVANLYSSCQASRGWTRSHRFPYRSSKTATVP